MEDLKVFFQETVPEEDAVPGAVIAIQSFGDFLDTILIFTFSVPMVVFMGMECSELRLVLRQSNWRRFSGTMSFPRCAGLLSKSKITEDLVDMLMKWRHSGFNVFCGSRIQPESEEAMENLARYIIRAFLSRLLFCAGGVSPRRE